MVVNEKEIFVFFKNQYKTAKKILKLGYISSVIARNALITINFQKFLKIKMRLQKFLNHILKCKYIIRQKLFYNFFKKKKNRSNMKISYKSQVPNGPPLQCGNLAVGLNSKLLLNQSVGPIPIVKEPFRHDRWATNIERAGFPRKHHKWHVSCACKRTTTL